MNPAPHDSPTAAPEAAPVAPLTQAVGHYENFPVASYLCPARLRPAVMALYHFARTADDMADEGDAPALARLAELARASGFARIVIAEAGVVLQTLHEAVAAHGLRFPLTLGGKGSATVGGLVSTNAGGTAVLRYGPMRDLVLGLEAVLPDGQIWNGLKRLRKDNTGYDLKQLLIGAEGT